MARLNIKWVNALFFFFLYSLLDGKVSGSGEGIFLLTGDLSLHLWTDRTPLSFSLNQRTLNSKVCHFSAEDIHLSALHNSNTVEIYKTQTELTGSSFPPLRLDTLKFH